MHLDHLVVARLLRLLFLRVLKLLGKEVLQLLLALQLLIALVREEGLWGEYQLLSYRLRIGVFRIFVLIYY